MTVENNARKDVATLPAWLQHAAEVEVNCESIAAAGLAAELGMIDREQLRKSRAAAEALAAAPESTSTAGG